MTTIITFEYYSQFSNYTNKTEETKTDGFVSTRGSQSMVENAQAFILTDKNSNSNGCEQPTNIRNISNRVAIIQRGGNCSFSVKITRAKQYGATAVIIYDPEGSGIKLYDMLQNNSDVLSVYVTRSIGSVLFNIAKDKQTNLNITLRPIEFPFDYNYPRIWFDPQSATIFIGISICILISLCIAWLLFYYCQRYHARTAKDRLQKHLSNAAKKALAKIPITNANENSQTGEPCVICLDAIQAGDTVRQLVCGHTFHHRCVDPWLLNHRHCPLCNLDILAAYRVSLLSTRSYRRQPNVKYHNNHSTVSSTTTFTSQPSQPQTTGRSLPTISATIKDNCYDVHMHGQQNPSFKPDESSL